jgi:hypothetical protein
MLIGIFYQSFKAVIYVLLPNIITLLTLSSIIGWLGIPIQLNNAIIFSVAFGIVVDDTIHFLASYNETNKSKSIRERLQDTFNTTGISIIFTSMVIGIGFSIFLLSSFGATFYMGLFMVLSVIIALIVDLFLLPAIISFKL